MATQMSKEMAKAMPPHKYWEMEGGIYPELQFVAMRVLSKPVGIGSVERSCDPPSLARLIIVWHD